MCLKCTHEIAQKQLYISRVATEPVAMIHFPELPKRKTRHIFRLRVCKKGNFTDMLTCFILVDVRCIVGVFHVAPIQKFLTPILFTVEHKNKQPKERCFREHILQGCLTCAVPQLSSYQLGQTVVINTANKTILHQSTVHRAQQGRLIVDP
jgi:hypothetical protein